MDERAQSRLHTTRHWQVRYSYSKIIPVGCDYPQCRFLSRISNISVTLMTSTFTFQSTVVLLYLILSLLEIKYSESAFMLMAPQFN